MSLAAFSDELAALTERVLPSVVALTLKAERGTAFGSGFVIDAAGHVVTNHHVIEDGGQIVADLPGRPARTAEIVGHDRLTDLAVLRLDEPPPSHLDLRAEPARLGELCLALGSPLGLFPESVSLGIVSGLARSLPTRDGVRSLERVLQTDCAINPGNSGGPLVDARGRVLGVNTAIRRDGAGIGFAVPAETVAVVAAELVAHGRVARASLGVAIAERHVEIDGRTVKRQVVTRVGSGSGLRVGDALLAVNGVEISGRAVLYDHLGGERIGAALTLAVHRDGALHHVEVIPAALDG
ncbi:trypsin-like peptidase domain-containing protein [Actinocorallia sp. API 0066]|uniref:S1C family serine protease n=1 Tax=Actinocorallia sp. API 0066 TaxID=2896846 RepID=UPI001E342433|nr:trypsin-like peptidase domain-containing protein [Actinocorallia sp. API 0066]MCD0447975.1 trypsin-like peptidase domain-containing protein [Actinocorallia sp. API 0066]